MPHRTTETLREMLFDAIEQVRDGTMDPRIGKNIADLADRIIKSAEIELKFSQTVSRLDAQGQGISPGPLLLTKEEPKK